MPATPPTVTTFNPPLTLESDQHTCWLTSITTRTSTHYHYALTIKEPHKYGVAFIRIPHDNVTPDMARTWQRHSTAYPGERLQIVQNNETKGVAHIGDLIAKDETTGEGVRQVIVHFQGHEYTGEVRDTGKDVREALLRAREEKTARKSIEPIPVESAVRRTVEFTRAPQKGRSTKVEVFSVDGRRTVVSDAAVLSVDRKEGRRFVTIRSRIPETNEWVSLKGDLDEDPSHRVARCVEVGTRGRTK